MADQFKVHCRIIDYITVKNRELAEIIRGVCADGSLGSLKGKPGVTFLMPTDKAFLKKLSELAYSANVDDVEKANELINNLIVRDIMRTPGDWMNHHDDIPNSLFPSQKLAVDSVAGDAIVFKSGAKAVVDKDFKDGSRGLETYWRNSSNCRQIERRQVHKTSQKERQDRRIHT